MTPVWLHSRAYMTYAGGMRDCDPNPIDTFEWLIDAISKETANRLRAFAGGTCLWVPENPERGCCRLVKIVGRVAARKISDTVGSGPIYIPVSEKRGPKARAARVIELTEQGRTVDEIAVIVGICARTVFRIRARHRARRERETTE